MSTKDVKLESIQLENFKGFRGQHEFKFDGRSVEVHGKNETGKSSLFDAITYLFFDRNHKGSHDFPIKTTDEDENVIPDLDHVDEAKLAIKENGDTRKVTLKKNYVEKRKDGQVTGHETKCYINGAKVNKGEFEDEVSGIIDEETFSLITDPTYFYTQLHWTERREMLLNMVERPTPEEIVEYNSELEDFVKAQDRQGFEKVERFKTYIDDQADELDDRLKEIKSELKTLRGQLPEDLPALEELQAKKEELEDRREELQDKISQAKAGGQKAELKNKLNEVKADIEEIRQKHQKQYREAKDEADRKIQEKKHKIKGLEGNLTAAKSKAENAEEKIEKLENKLQKLRERYDKLAEQDEVVCPTCGQKVEGEKAAELTQDDDWNLEQGTTLEELNESGLTTKEQLEEAKEHLAEFQEKREKFQEAIENKEYTIEKLESAKDNLDKPSTTLAEDDEYQDLQEKKDELETKIANAEDPDLSEEKQKLSQVKANLDQVQKKIARHEAAQNTRGDIDDLEDEQQTKSAQLDDLERLEYLEEKWTRAEMELVESKVNDLFDITNWTLFERQLNGKLNETCYPTNEGTPADGFSTSQAIKVGLDIIKTLNEQHQVRAPIFIDRAESISKLPDMKSQLISLVVDPAAEDLQIEASEKQAKQKELV